MFDYLHSICFDTLWRQTDMSAIMRLGGIYIIQNEVNGKIYVGSARSFFGRYQRHRWALENNNHWNSHLQCSYNKHHNNNFTFNILEIVNDRNELLDREQYWLDELRPTDDVVGYNYDSIAGPTHNLGKSPSQETRDKISKSLTGRVGCNKGIKWSSEHKIKISEGLKKLKINGYILPQSRPVEFYDTFEDSTEIFTCLDDARKFFNSDCSTFKKYDHKDKLFRKRYLIKILK